MCDRCETVATDQGAPFRTWKDPSAHPCKSCGKTLAKGFLYCPYCGNRV